MAQATAVIRLIVGDTSVYAAWMRYAEGVQEVGELLEAPGLDAALAHVSKQAIRSRRDRCVVLVRTSNIRFDAGTDEKPLISLNRAPNAIRAQAREYADRTLMARRQGLAVGTAVGEFDTTLGGYPMAVAVVDQDLVTQVRKALRVRHAYVIPEPLVYREAGWYLSIDYDASWLIVSGRGVPLQVRKLRAGGLMQLAEVVGGDAQLEMLMQVDELERTSPVAQPYWSWLAVLFQEAESLLQATPGQRPAVLMLAGAGARLPWLATAVNTYMQGLRAVAPPTPVGLNVDTEYQYDGRLYPMLAALALNPDDWVLYDALGATQTAITSASALSTAQYRRPLIAVGAAAVCVAVVVPLGWGWGKHLWAQHQFSQAQAVAQRLARYDVIYRDVVSVQSLVHTVQAAKDPWAQQLAQILGTLPPGAYVTQLTAAGDQQYTQINLTVMAPGTDPFESLHDWLDRLYALPGLNPQVTVLPFQQVGAAQKLSLDLVLK